MEFSEWAKHKGWKALIVPCLGGDAPNSRSAGVAVFVRQELGLGWPRQIPMHSRGRAMIVQVQPPGAPPLLVANVYYWHTKQ